MKITNELQSGITSKTITLSTIELRLLKDKWESIMKSTLTPKRAHKEFSNFMNKLTADVQSTEEVSKGLFSDTPEEVEEGMDTIVGHTYNADNFEAKVAEEVVNADEPKINYNEG